MVKLQDTVKFVDDIKRDKYGSVTDLIIHRAMLKGAEICQAVEKEAEDESLI